MTKKYNELDPRRELEQRASADLEKALAKRGATVKHHGTAATHAPATAPADITIDFGTGRNKQRVLVEVAQRSDESEFTSLVAHLDAAVAGGAKANVIYAGRSTSLRMARFIRNENIRRNRLGLVGRIIFVKLNDLQELLTHWASASKSLYPVDGLLDCIGRWPEFTTDLAAMAVMQSTLFPTWTGKAEQLDRERQQALAIRQERLRKDIAALENKIRERGITGERAHKVILFLFFCALYEEKRGPASRMTRDGFLEYRNRMPSADRSTFRNRTVHHLFKQEIEADPEIGPSGMLAHYVEITLDDDFILEEVIPIFEGYPLSEGGIDFIGAVFEALARRAEKDNRIGQFFTPETAVLATVRLAALRSGDLVLDPACGTGRFLIHAMEWMCDAARKAGQSGLVNGIKQHQLLGTDIEPWVATIAKMNMYLHGDGKSNIRAENGLSLSAFNAFPSRSPGNVRDAVDVVLMNPPLGDVNFKDMAKQLALNGHLGSITATTPDERAREVQAAANNWTAERMGVVPHVCEEEERREELTQKLNELITKLVQANAAGDAKTAARVQKRMTATQAELADVIADIGAGRKNYRPSGQTAKGGALFLSAVLDYIKPIRDLHAPEEWQGGVVGTVIDEAILNTPQYKAARRFIVENYFIKAVISLPRDAFEFLARTSAKTTILLLARKPDKDVVQREPVFYAKAECIGYTSSGPAMQNDLNAINESFDRWREAAQGSYAGVNSAFSKNRALAAFKKAGKGGIEVQLYDLNPQEPEERLDYAYRRMRELTAKMQGSVALSSIIEPVVRNPDLAEVYEYATITSNDGRVRRKGPQITQYKPADLRLLKAKDILVSGIDAVRGSVGVVGPDCNGLVVSKEFMTFRTKAGVDAAPEYVASLLRSNLMREILEGTITGVSNRTRIESPNVLLDVRVPALPPRTRQDQVVKKLKAAFVAQDKAAQTLAEIEGAFGGL